MADDKVYGPETIPDNPFPNQDIPLSFEVTQPSTGLTGNKTSDPKQTEEQNIPTKKVATELISAALNTHTRKIIRAFQFTPSGALQIGDYKNGEAGDIRISPVGIVARSVLGNVTFSLDGDTGDAIFAGTIQSGALVSGKVMVGDGNIIIDGESKRMIFYDANGIPSIIIGMIS